LSIYSTILSKGYLPKELPPAFDTESFARFATSKAGRDAIRNYKPSDQYTECCEFHVSRTGNDSREFKIPHPFHFAKISSLCAANFSKLLRKANASPFSSSKPNYSVRQPRAIQPRTAPGTLSRDRSLSRGASSYLLRADISHFYPSLYTHAVGWAIDPKLRKKQNWRNQAILGKKIDQNLMDLDRKFSQGIPIGNDISFLLAELVLATVDAKLECDPARSFRYFDDYEFACSSEKEAHKLRECLESELAKFRLRLNPRKTEIVKLPQTAQDEWQDSLLNASRIGLKTSRDLIRFFDTAFRLRLEHPNASVLSFALGVLFRIPRPDIDVGKIVESAVSQTVLCEPGSCQKALSLIAYWSLNGYQINAELFSRTISVFVSQSLTKGTHDLMWALSFCIDKGISLDEAASAKLKEVNNDAIAILALHLQRKNLLQRTFDRRSLSKRSKNWDLDREHWLLCYEGARLGFLTPPVALVKSNPLFTAMLNAGVGFYQMKMPTHSFVVAQGSAPDWLLKSWIKRTSSTKGGQDIPKQLQQLILASLAENKGTSLTPSQFRNILRLSDLPIEGEQQPEATSYE